MGRGDVRNMHQVFFELVAIESFAARTFHIDPAGLARFPLVRRQPLASFPHRIFSRGPIPLIPPFPEIGFRSPRQKRAPSLFEIGAGFIEGGGTPVRAFSGMTAGIEAARPAPGTFPGRHASADARSHPRHVTVKDVPAFFGGIGGASAGEGGHGAIEPHTAAVRKSPLQVGLGYKRSHCRSRVFAN